MVGRGIGGFGGQQEHARNTAARTGLARMSPRSDLRLGSSHVNPRSDGYDQKFHKCGLGDKVMQTSKGGDCDWRTPTGIVVGFFLIEENGIDSLGQPLQAPWVKIKYTEAGAEQKHPEEVAEERLRFAPSWQRGDNVWYGGEKGAILDVKLERGNPVVYVKLDTDHSQHEVGKELLRKLILDD